MAGGVSFSLLILAGIGVAAVTLLLWALSRK
jgi:hypothetical protein